MDNKALETVCRYEMLKDGDSVVVGLSGGADSMALICFLYKLKNDLDINIYAAHLNHCIRGDEADRDENFVRDFCKSKGIKLYIKRVDIKTLALKTGLSEEECGREERYKFFNEVASKYVAKIATAHTLSDSTETFILNFTRGTGAKGLSGIPPVRDNIIRPLIFVSREEIERYCEINDIKYINDSTNFEENYTRNKIRLSVVPILKSINPMFIKCAGRAIERISEDNRYLSELTNKHFLKCTNAKGYDCNYINSLDDCLKKRVIVKILNTVCKKAVEASHVDMVLKCINDDSGGVTLPGNVNLLVKNKLLFLKKKPCKIPKWEYKIKDSNNLTEQGKTFIIKLISFFEYDKYSINNKRVSDICVDADLIPDGSVFRNRRDGDIFKPLGRGITKSIKKLFNELKIPVDKRNSVTFLAHGNDVIWIEGIGISDKYKITKNTKTIAMILKGKNCDDGLYRESITE